jgi:hypothetical protein
VPPVVPGTLSLGRTLVLATVFHAGLFAIGSRASTSAQTRRVEPMKLVWVEATREVESAPATPVEEDNASSVDTSRTAVALPHERIKPTAMPMASAVALPESAPSASGAWTLHIMSDRGASAPRGPTLGELGLDGKNHFLGSRETKPNPPPDPERAARERGNRAAGEAMRAALHDEDVALGLGGAGPVVTALEDAVFAGTAPLESHTVLVAIADASGIVTRVDVESFSDDPASFRAIADDVLRRLHDKRVRVPAASHGLSMRIDVSSRLGLPSGAGPGGVGYDSRHVGMNFDMSDVGAHVGRVVHARVLGEQLL